MWVVSCFKYQARKLFSNVAGQWLYENYEVVRNMTELVEGLGARAY